MGSATSHLLFSGSHVVFHFLLFLFLWLFELSQHMQFHKNMSHKRRSSSYLPTDPVQQLWYPSNGSGSNPPALANPSFQHHSPLADASSKSKGVTTSTTGPTQGCAVPAVPPWQMQEGGEVSFCAWSKAKRQETPLQDLQKWTSRFEVPVHTVWQLLPVWRTWRQEEAGQESSGGCRGSRVRTPEEER